MLSGEPYNPLDRQPLEERLCTRLLLQALNDSAENEPKRRTAILKESIRYAGNELWIQPPLYCNYGSNTILAVMQVKVGNRRMFGPYVQIYTATHPLDPMERASGLEFAKPVEKGEDV